MGVFGEMKMKRSDIVSMMLGMILMVLSGSCSVIDENLDNCGEELRLDYDLRLVTNLSIELQAELDRRHDANLIKALREYLAPVFTDYAHDLDLSFYDVQGDYARLHHEQHIMDANELSYTIYLPRRQYKHAAVANVERNSVVTLEGGDFCYTSQLLQSQEETVTPHKTGLFTARNDIHLEDGVNKTYYIHMYMANCGAALVLDTREATFKDIKVVAKGFASRFNIADSTFVFAGTSPVVIADRIETGNSGQMCFCTVNFPSRAPGASKARDILDWEDPRSSVDTGEILWQFDVDVTMADGSVTHNELGVRTPLLAAQFDILHAHVYPNGSLESSENEVAVSVTLDWKEDGEYVVPL